MKAMLTLAVTAAFLAAPSAYAAGADGAKVFNSTCAACHGATGTNIPGVKLFSKAFVGKLNVEQIVTNGTAKGMPSFKGRLSAAEIKAVAAYVKGHAK